MSKRKSVGNTLFNYFTKTPPSNKKLKPIDADSNIDVKQKILDPEPKLEQTKRERQPTSSPELNKTREGSDEDSPILPKKRKRIRLNPVDSDDSDVENRDSKTPSKVKDSLHQRLQDSFKYDPNDSPKNGKEKKVSLNGSTISQSKPVEQPEAPILAEDGDWTHCKLDWLKPDKIRDAKKRRPDHPDYDPTTLYVPPEYYKTQTPGHKQWWDMKSAHFDCVLFFKVGKFYELYHMDAAVGVNELGFSYMKGAFAHSGFPESAYGRMASTLVSKGYKVARVEQTETPEMMQERCKKVSGKMDKVVRREICQLAVRGAQVCGLQDPGPSDASAVYLLAIAEEESNGCSTYGVCFVDTSIGQFHLGQFQDDKHSSRLLTTVAHYPPALLVFDRKHTSQRTSRLLLTHCPSARREPTTMWSPEKTLNTLAEKYYRTTADGSWPDGLKPFLHEGDALGLTPAASCYLAVKALGGCVTYLTECLLDIQILDMAQFTSYSPPDVVNKTLSPEIKAQNQWRGGNTMVLDAITLKNLRIVQDEGCLYDKLNFCCTPMGKRLLYQWVCSPSCNLAVIKSRQEAVKTLFEDQELCQDTKNILMALPDLERLLANACIRQFEKSKNHPDARAIFYEEKTYSKRKVLDFISVLQGFSSLLKLVEMFSNVKPMLLRKVTQFPSDGNFPDYRETLKFFKEAFDQKEAEKEGRILPGQGVDPEYDSTLRKIQEIEQELQDYLVEQEKYFKCREFLSRMIAAEEQKTNVLKDLSRRIFERFSTHYNQWEAAVQCISTLDILLAFAEFARQQNGDICLPQIDFDSSKMPYIEIVEGRHPCIPNADEFIPNDTRLGAGRSLLLLTGPNMGGKSTLMRQLGLLTVLAHMGSYVLAQECNMSLVDRIFTRLGASDDILSGQSTFLVEMNETAAIVKHATVNSLVLLDELGRGTSTYDGTAIASAVCVELSARRCRCVFSTHYHSLVQYLAKEPGLMLGHMACMVETEECGVDAEDEIPEETLTFLYKLSPGACPKSYGFNAARLAGIPREITKRAQLVSRTLEKEASCARTFRDVFRKDAEDLRKLLSSLDI